MSRQSPIHPKSSPTHLYNAIDHAMEEIHSDEEAVSDLDSTLYLEDDDPVFLVEKPLDLSTAEKLSM